MGADQEVCQNAAGARVSLFPSTRSVTLEGSARCPPDRFIQGPVNADTGFLEERIQERFTAARGRHQLSEDRGSSDQGSAPQCCVQRRLGSGAKRWIPIPERHDDISVNSCRHCPRSSRTHRIIPSLPEPIPGFPIPLNFANGLLVLTGRTRTPFSSLSNSNLSPGRTPSTRRTSRGTVICPLLVILACFSNTSPPRFLTLPHTLLTLKMMLRLRLCNLVAPGTADAQEAVQARGQEGTDGAGIEPWEIIYFNLYPSQVRVIE